MGMPIEAIRAHQRAEAERAGNPARTAALDGLGAHVAHLREAGHLTEDVPAGLFPTRSTVFTAESVSPHKFKPVKFELLTPTQLVEKAHEEARAFGIDVPVSKPTEQFIETQKIAEGEGLGVFDPLHFVAVTLSQDAKYPGLVTPLGPWLYDQIRNGYVAESSLQIDESWALFDGSERPDYDNGKQMFKDDPLAPLLEAGRRLGQIAVPSHVSGVPIGSRFGVSMDEQDGFVFPKLAERLRLVDAVAAGTAEVRRPTVAEFNYAGNLRYAHLGEANTWEGFNDKFGDGRRLIGGYSDDGGLSSVHYCPTGLHHDGVAFRPLVVPSK